MYIYFDTNGTIKEVINDESIRRGSSDYNKIYCYLEGNPDIDDIWYLQKNPDGTLTNEVSFVDNIVTKAIPYDAKRDMKYFQDFEEYQFYVFTLSSSYLSQNGLVVATIRVEEDNTLWALGELTFNVQANIVNSDNDITQSQYDYLLLAYASRTLNEQTGSDLDDLLDEKIEAKANDIIEPIFNDYKETIDEEVENQNETIASLIQASPRVFDTASNIGNLQENKGVAVATDTGYIYYWDSTLSTPAYVSSGLQYNSLVDYVKHNGNQLLDGNNNNIYPIVANESIIPIKLDRIYVNGIVGKNKFDYTSLQQGYCSDVDGSFSTSTAWHYTKVDVSNFTSGHIQLSGTLTYAKIAFFNSSNQFISGWSGSQSATTKNFTISTLSQTPKYFYISILSSNDGTNIQVEDHDGATTFEEYKGILNNNSINEAQTTFMNDLIYLSKNMLDVVDKSNQYCSLTNNNDGSWLINNNNTTNVSRLMLIKEIYLEVGDYSLSSNVVNDDGSDYGGIYIYDTNTMTHKIISITYGTYISNKGVFTISTSGTYYIYASTPSNSTKTFTCYAQLEKGLQTTQWVKAYGQVIINEATKKYIDLNFVYNNEIKSLLNISKLKNTYRYLVPTFYGSTSDGLIILGTNDLRTFDLIYKKGIFTATKTFNNGANTNTLRDPAIIQINDYYYFVYSIMSFVTGDNKIGMCRTKDFITFEELDNISIDDPTSTHTYIAIWAPDWFRNGNKIYLSMTGKYGNTNFETVVYEYNPETHTISNGFVKSFDGRIDGHFYKLNGNYYCAIGGFHLFKSTSLDGTYTEISIGSTYANCEASFIVRKDDGTYRFYAQQLSAHYGTAHMIYKDSVSTNLEDGFGDVNFVEYTDEALDYAKEIHNAETLNDEYWHWTVFDFNNSNFNNNNFTD